MRISFSLCILKYTLNNVFTNYIIQLHNELSIAQCNDLLNCKLQIAFPFEFYYIYASIVLHIVPVLFISRIEWLHVTHMSVYHSGFSTCFSLEMFLTGFTMPSLLSTPKDWCAAFQSRAVLLSFSWCDDFPWSIQGLFSGEVSESSHGLVKLSTFFMHFPFVYVIICNCNFCFWKTDFQGCSFVAEDTIFTTVASHIPILVCMSFNPPAMFICHAQQKCSWVNLTWCMFKYINIVRNPKI